MGTDKFSFYRDEPFFGLDIGHSSMKVMQLEQARDKSAQVVGYGVSNYYRAGTIQDGVVADVKSLAEAMHELFADRLVGIINTHRVACTVPTSNTFSRPLTLPPMDTKQIEEAIRLEAEQYIPIPIDQLYIDYDVSRRDESGVDVLMVATPKQIVDSYISFLEAVGLQPISMEPTMNASARLFKMADVRREEATVLVDFGSVAVDVAVFDQAMFVNSTIQGGSDTLTAMIADHLEISPSEAYVIKSKYGVAPDSEMPSVSRAAKPVLDSLVKEIRRIIRYYDDRSAKRHRKITQIITTGGGATIKGLETYLSDQLGLQAHRLDPWNKIKFGNLQAPSELARSMYITVAGEAVLTPQELFND